jgi:hypothetical protein
MSVHHLFVYAAFLWTSLEVAEDVIFVKYPSIRRSEVTVKIYGNPAFAEPPAQMINYGGKAQGALA